jgi:hypothetical protein
MVKLKGAFFSVAAFGALDDTLVYQRRRGLATVYRKRVVRNPNSEAQASQRASFASAVYSWLVMPSASKVRWHQRAVGTALTGYNLYLKNYLLGLLEE